MPHLERSPSEYSIPKNKSAKPSTMAKMPPNAISPDVKCTIESVLQHREQYKGIQLTHNYEPQNHTDQKMASEYIANEANISDASAFTTTSSPKIAVLSDFKGSPKAVSEHLTTVNLTYSAIQNFDHKSESHQTCRLGSTSSTDVTVRSENSSVDHEESISTTEVNKDSSSTDCKNKLKRNLSNARNSKQRVTVKKHEQTRKKTIKVTLHQCQDFYLKK